jgi:hypothetical protein
MSPKRRRAHEIEITLEGRRHQAHMKLALISLSALALSAVACARVPDLPPGGPAKLVVTPEATGSQYHVNVSAADGSQHQCDAPCTLNVPSGTARVSVTGDGSFIKKVVVPQGESTLTLEHANKGLTTASYGLLGGGFATLLGCLVVSNGENVQLGSVLGWCGSSIVLNAGSLILGLMAGKNAASVAPRTGVLVLPGAVFGTF